MAEPTPRPLSAEPWGVLLAALMYRQGVQALTVDVVDLQATRLMDLDVVDGPAGVATIRLVPMTEAQLAAVDEDGA